MKYLAVVLTLAALLLGGNAWAEDYVTRVNLLAPLMVPTTKEERAQFADLKPDAVQMGLGDAVLVGSVTYQPTGANATRVTIQWHSITAATMNGGGAKALASPLVSQFTTTDQRIDPQAINARGDLEKAAEDWLAVKASMKNGTAKDTIEKTTNNNTENVAQRDPGELSNTGSSGSNGSGGGYSNAPYSTTNNGVTTDMITTSWQDCTPRVDHAAGIVYAQARKIETTESGRLISTGACEDHGNQAPIVRTYDGTCQIVTDIANRKVYHQFTEAATLDSKAVQVSACTVDFTKSDPILATTTGCGYRHDFTAGVSIQQEKLYYNAADGSMVPVRDCGDSTNSYKQYTTQNTCTPTVDQVNNQVFFNVRVAFLDGNGAEQYATDCKPDGNPATPISEEYCNPKYEHDFVNHVSYYRTRAYYVDSTGTKQYVSQCARSALNSFPHVFVTGACTVTNDDTLLMTHWYKETHITTPDDGDLTIAPCQEMGSPTPYAYKLTRTVAQPDVNLSTQSGMFIGTFAQAIAGVNTSDPLYNCAGSTDTYYTPAAFSGPVALNICDPSLNGVPFYAVWSWIDASSPVEGALTRHHTTTYQDYLRGDGTTYSKPMQETYTFSKYATSRFYP